MGGERSWPHACIDARATPHCQCITRFLYLYFLPSLLPLPHGRAQPVHFHVLVLCRSAKRKRGKEEGSCVSPLLFFLFLMFFPLRAVFYWLSWWFFVCLFVCFPFVFPKLFILPLTSICKHTHTHTHTKQDTSIRTHLTFCLVFVLTIPHARLRSHNIGSPLSFALFVSVFGRVLFLLLLLLIFFS